jgi:hypothetical protein
MQFDAEVADIGALQAVNRGDASPDQQKRVVAWVLRQLAGIPLSTFHVDPCASAFAEGRKYVGLKMVQALNLPMRELLDNEG